jgi:hypothetical protein
MFTFLTVIIRRNASALSAGLGNISGINNDLDNQEASSSSKAASSMSKKQDIIIDIKHKL